MIEVDGAKIRFMDWRTDPGAIRSLLFRARKILGVNYREVNAPLRRFSGNPAEVPIIYITGHVDFRFSPDEMAKLRAFLLAGGYLWGEACCGAREFTEAFKRLAAQILPARPIKRLSPDHPLFRSHYRLKQVRYAPAVDDRPAGLPYLLGADVGCRTALILSPYDLSCGWDGHSHEGKRAVSIEDANRLGINMIAYCLAYHKVGRFLAQEKVYHEQGEPTRGDFVLGIVKHSGYWDPDPSRTVNLLKAVERFTSSKVKFQRKAVSLADSDLYSCPFLYMTGHDDFVLSAEEVARLRSYLGNGGFLFADSCCGRLEFERAFRRELNKVLPRAELRPLDRDHPLYGCRFKVSSVRYSPAVQAESPGLSTPPLEGVVLGGETRVIFSRYDLGSGWEGVERPFARAVSADDALRLGVNTVVYSLTH
jgi:hypothetical protein